MELLPKGKKYAHLKTSYVIFICTFDPTGTDEAVSTFEFYNIKKQLPLKDRRYIIFVNTKSEERAMPGDLQSLFEYINHNSVDENDTFLRKLENDIEELNHENEEWRRDVMKLEEKFAWAREDAMEEGLTKGKEMGIAQANIKTAKKMKSKGYEKEEIAEMTGLTAEEIEQL